MPSILSLSGFLALGAAAVSAMGMVPALPNPLGKRIVECGGDWFCKDNYYCIPGPNGIPRCCPDGEVCTGTGGIKTTFYTTFFTTTYFTTYTTTGVTTEVITTEVTTTEKPVYTTTVTTYDITVTPTVVTDYWTTYTTYTTESVLTKNATVTYPTSTYGNVTGPTQPPYEGGAAGRAVNVGLAGMVVAVLAVVMV